MPAHHVHYELRLAPGMVAAGLAVTTAMAVGMIGTIASVAVAGVLARDRFMAALARTEKWRHHAGNAMGIASSLAVIVIGLWPLLRRILV